MTGSDNISWGDVSKIVNRVTNKVVSKGVWEETSRVISKLTNILLHAIVINSVDSLTNISPEKIADTTMVMLLEKFCQQQMTTTRL